MGRGTGAGDETVESDLDGQIAALERRLSRKRAELATKRIVPVSRDGALVCTRQQEGLWFEHQLDPASTVYHIPFALRLRGALDKTALHRALHALVTRHEALRTRFVAEDGLPRQIIDPAPADLPLAVVDIPADAVNTWATEQIRRPLDLATGPVFRTALARLAPDEHVLVLVAHHIVADGWSAGILTSELSRLYAAETGLAAGARLPALTVQPADHAAWQRTRLDDAQLSHRLEHWRTTLADLPTLDFPTDRPRPAHPTGAGARIGRPLPGNLSAAAHRYARDNHVSFLAIHQAALLTVLHRYTGQTDLPIGSIFSGRTRTDIEPLVGYFANTVVLRTHLDGDPTFAELIHRCHETVLEASTHQDIPFSLIVDALQPDRIPGRNPLFQISLTLQPALAQGELSLGTLTADPIDITTGNARFDLAIDIDQTPNGHLAISTEYSTELFDTDRIHRLLDHYTTALAHGLAEPHTPAEDIDILSPNERDHILHTWNDTVAGYHAKPLHQVIVGHDPESVAVRFQGTELTYRELDRRSNLLAHALREHGIDTGHIVALLLDRGPHLPVAELAVLKAGAAWTMLDPQHPPARLGFMAKDAAVPLILTTTDLAELATASAPHTACWCLDERRFNSPDTAPQVDVRPEDPAYLIYTSGSTGTPKGVLVSHRSAYAYSLNAVEQFHTTAADRVAQAANPAFDAHIFDCYPSLLAGATLISAPRDTFTDPTAFTDLIHAERVTLSFIPPAVLALLDPDQLTGTALRAIACGGEALPPGQANRWSRPGLELHNPYGPTETTVVVTDYICPTTPVTTPPPIGSPLPNQRAYVLDGRLRPVPIGVPGQLHIAGTGLAHGYLNRPALTAQSFLPDPYGPPGQRMYATGDLARWRADGLLECLGRRDRQVQIRGQRIELGEIEHTLAQHPGVRQSAVVLSDDRYLTAYIVGDPYLDDVRRHLAGRLPTYMIPTNLVTLPELPLTPNGKLDTDRLPVPAPGPADRYLEPRTDTERWLADTWRDLLSADRVGTADNFFDLGGNSLLATQLVARIRDRFGVTLHPHVLFADPTLDRLAALVDRTGDEDDAAPGHTGVITLHRATGRLPLILVHPAGGSVTSYARLARTLGDDQPVHAIEDPALAGADPAGDLTARARLYLELIRRMRPNGPYHLGGWSLGGVIALEMARQLADAGAPVGTVVLLDPGLPADLTPPDDLSALSAFVHDLACLADAAPPDVDPDTLRGLDREVLEALALDVLDNAGLVPSGLRDDVRLRMRAFIGNVRALYAHQPRRYDGPVTLIQTVDSADTDHATWDMLCPQMERRTVPGDHYTMLRPPHLAALATAVGDALREPVTVARRPSPAMPSS